MARRLVEESPGIRELKQFELANVKFTGKELGTGSYGSVEVVEIPGASCAAKTIHQVLIQSVAQQIGRQERRGRGYVPRSIIEGFVTECTLMSTLRHPHIVQFLGICYPPGAQLPALVMELLLTSLHKMLESTDDIPMSIKNSILRDVARGLVFLHSLDPSVIHRDLTASNVLVDSSLTAKISDLGMARLLNIQAGRHAATMTKGPGNASYMPPEAKDGDVTKYGKPIDTFSMGNLILFTATQEIPDPINPTFYDPKSRSTKARTEIERRVNSFHILWKMFGKEHPLVLLANQCLQDNPEIRPTAPEILQRLDMMPIIPYRDWDMSKINLVQDVLEKEQRIAKLEDCLVEQEKKVVKLHNQYAQSSLEKDTQLDPTSVHKHNRSQLKQLKLDDGATQVKRHPPRDSVQSQPSDHYEPIPGGSPSPAERSNHHGHGQSASIEHRPNVQNWQKPEPQQQHDNLHKNVTVANCNPEANAFHHYQNTPGPSNTQAPQNQRGPANRDSGSGAFQNTSASKNPVSQNSPMLRENVPVPDYQTKPPLIDQQHVAAVVSSPSQPSHWQPLDIGSTIQIPSTEYGHPMRYGVIRWIGELPGVPGLIAGVELDEEMEGCTDGTWFTTGQAFFHCTPGKGLYYGLYNLKPDSRFNSASSISLNPLQVPMEELVDQPIEDATQQMLKYLGDEKGIQGHQNSCYMDSALFGLFALSDVFDTMFLDANQTVDQNRIAISSLLWKGIVNPLRKNGVVRFESVMKLRNKLDEIWKMHMEGITVKEKDPEEFLNMLFKHTLRTKPFISIKRPFGIEQEFFVQLFVEYDPNLRLPTVGDLLRKMFHEQHISFTKVPSRLLISIPRFGRDSEFKTYQKIVPDLKLRITELTDTFINATIPSCFICWGNSVQKCCDCNFTGPNSDVYYCTRCSETFHGNPLHPDRTKHNVQDAVDFGFMSELDLLSVICIETSHYVCFTRDPTAMDEEHKWIFFDSMANRLYDKYNIPKVTDCTAALNEWVYPPNGDRTRLMSTQPRQLPELVRRFTQDVYMCVYIQPDVCMYGDEV